jgi:hypothetical protein
MARRPIAVSVFSSEVDTGSREENTSRWESGASVLIQSEPKIARVLACLWWVQIPLEPPSKSFGLHRVFIRSKCLKGLIADGASKRMQVDVPRGGWLDADEHHRSFASRASGTTDCSKRSNGRHAQILGHEGFPLIGGSATLSVTDGCQCGAVITSICPSRVSNASQFSARLRKE